MSSDPLLQHSTQQPILKPMINIESPVSEFPGTIELPEYLTLPQVIEYDQAARDSKDITDAMQKNLVLLPMIFKITGTWNIKGIDPKPTMDTFPYTPIIPATMLVSWLHRNIIKIIVGEKTIPNA